MGLKTQIVLLGLLTLLLPWASVPVIKQFEAALRQGQAQALEVTATAIATQIIENRELLLPLDQTAQRLGQISSLWFVPVATSEPAVDGYFDEWDRFGPCLGQSIQSAITAECSLRRTQENVYIALTIHDAQRQFFHPSRDINQSDHLQLRLEGKQSVRDMRIFSSAAGSAQVVRVDPQGGWTAEHRIKAAWTEHVDSYALELKIPARWLEHSLALSVCDGADFCATAETKVYPVLLQSVEVASVLANFNRPEVRTRVVLADRWVLAESGQLQNPEPVAQDGWLRWLLRWLVGQESLPNYPRDGLGITLSAPSTLAYTRWYSTADGAIAQAALPLDGYQSTSKLWVLVEQNSHTVDALAGGALGKLLMYSAGIGALVALALLAYASFLSLRIVRLNRLAQGAVDRQGRFLAAFQVSMAKDEIGELSRGYGALLTRLHGYTQFLESFNQKLSHELRTPIAIVRSSLDNLRNAADNQKEVYLQRASEGLDRLSTIFNAMSAATRIEQALQSSECQQFNVTRVMDELADAYRAIHPGQLWQYQSHSESELLLLGSADLFAQMMDKLVDNAVEFAGPGGAISLSLTSQGKTLVIRVANTGPPLPMHLQNSIFDSLVSVRDGNQDGHHLGLGLYVVRLIVDFHHGFVQAYNHPDGQQVIFELSFPKADPLAG